MTRSSAAKQFSALAAPKNYPKSCCRKALGCELFVSDLIAFLFAILLDALPSSEVLLTLLQEAVGLRDEPVEERVARNANAVEESKL
jgi:hypothetical protein